MLGTYTEGFTIVFEPTDERSMTAQAVLQLCCLDASIATRSIFKRFQSVVITSGTLSPLYMYPRILDFVPCVRRCPADGDGTRGEQENSGEGGERAGAG